MKYISQVLLLTSITLIIACSGVENVATNTNTATITTNSLYPNWYGSYEFSTDSTSFYARATAVASDENTAKIRAEKEARALLESYIAKELEDIRTELESDGSTIVKKPDFILMLRNAHLEVEEEAELMYSTVSNSKDIFRGFARVEISKKQLNNLIKNGLSSKYEYSDVFTTSEGFIDFVGIR